MDLGSGEIASTIFSDQANDGLGLGDLAGGAPFFNVPTKPAVGSLRAEQQIVARCKINTVFDLPLGCLGNPGDTRIAVLITSSARQRGGDHDYHQKVRPSLW
jgi:hypothetical protein